MFVDNLLDAHMKNRKAIFTISIGRIDVHINVTISLIFNIYFNQFFTLNNYLMSVWVYDVYNAIRNKNVDAHVH